MISRSKWIEVSCEYGPPEVVVDVDEAGAALRRTEQPKLLWAIEQPVAVGVEELIAQARVADRVLVVGNARRPS